MEPIRYRTLVEADYVELVRPIVPDAAVGGVHGDRRRRTSPTRSPGLARFRVNLFRQQRGSGAVFRVIPTKIMTLEQLGLPEPVRRLAAHGERPRARHRAHRLRQVDDARRRSST